MSNLLETMESQLPAYLVPTHIPDEFASEEAKQRDKTRRKVWNALASTVPKTGYKPPDDRPIQILELACGEAEAAPVYSAFFGGNDFGEESQRVYVTGIDINTQAIKLAQGIIANEERAATHYDFRVADASSAQTYIDIPNPDVVIIRNQEMRSDDYPDLKLNWEEIIHRATELVPPGGIGIITSVQDLQRDLIQPVLVRSGVEILIDENAPHAVGPFNTWDKQVTIFRRDGTL
jgi:hypothetical protein